MATQLNRLRTVDYVRCRVHDWIGGSPSARWFPDSPVRYCWDVPDRRSYVPVDGTNEAAAEGDAERRVVFSGVTNFRDLGGYPMASGGQTRWGQVFRSDSLHNLADEDFAAFDALGIRAIFDLRRHDEREREPSRLACVHLELPSRRVDDTDARTLRERIDGERWLFEDYRGMLEGAGPVFGRLFSDLADRPGPAVFHCTGGKDRTGSHGSAVAEVPRRRPRDRAR